MSINQGVMTTDDFRKKNLTELVSTEKTYLESIGSLVVYKEQILKLAKDRPKLQNDLSAMLNILDSIKQVNQQLKDEFEKLNVANEEKDQKKIEKATKQIADLLKISRIYHGQYSVLYQKAYLPSLENKENASVMKKINVFLDELTGKSLDNSFDKIAIMPVQRMPRYMLFGREIIKYTPNDHPSYGSLQGLAGEMQQAADFVNDQIKKSERSDFEMKLSSFKKKGKLDDEKIKNYIDKVKQLEEAKKIKIAKQPSDDMALDKEIKKLTSEIKKLEKNKHLKSAADLFEKLGLYMPLPPNSKEAQKPAPPPTSQQITTEARDKLIETLVKLQSALSLNARASRTPQGEADYDKLGKALEFIYQIESKGKVTVADMQVLKQRLELLNDKDLRKKATEAINVALPQRSPSAPLPAAPAGAPQPAKPQGVQPSSSAATAQPASPAPATQRPPGSAQAPSELEARVKRLTEKLEAIEKYGKVASPNHPLVIQAGTIYAAITKINNETDPTIKNAQLEGLLGSLAKMPIDDEIKKALVTPAAATPKTEVPISQQESKPPARRPPAPPIPPKPPATSDIYKKFQSILSEQPNPAPSVTSANPSTSGVPAAQPAELKSAQVQGRGMLFSSRGTGTQDPLPAVPPIASGNQELPLNPQQAEVVAYLENLVTIFNERHEAPKSSDRAIINDIVEKASKLKDAVLVNRKSGTVADEAVAEISTALKKISTNFLASSALKETAKAVQEIAPKMEEYKKPAGPSR